MDHVPGKRRRRGKTNRMSTSEVIEAALRRFPVTNYVQIDRKRLLAKLKAYARQEGLEY